MAPAPLQEAHISTARRSGQDRRALHPEAFGPGKSDVPTPSDMAGRKLAHKLQFTIIQANRNSLPVWLTCIFITYPAWSVAPGWLLVTWVLAVGTTYLARNHLLRAGRNLTTLEQALKPWSRRLLWTTGALGLTVALGPLLIFPHLDDIGRMYITMVLCCWLGAAMSSLGAWPRLFAAYAALFNGGLMLAWWLADSGYLWQILVMLAMQALLMLGFAINFARQFEQSVDIRFANEDMLRQLGAARLAAESASEAKSRFLAVASHDLRQPLHAVILLNGMLARAQPSDRVFEISRHMDASLSALEKLLNSVLDFSKIEADRVQPQWAWHPLEPMFERLAAEYAPQARSRGLKLHISALPLEVHTDMQLLDRIVRNLLDNALKFTERGEIGLEALARPAGLALCVSDSGPGIAANLRDEIFKEYFQAAGEKTASGLGLGLAIVRRLASLLDLQVSVHDAVPQGARFEVAFDASQVRTKGARSEMGERGSGLAAPAPYEGDLRGYFVAYVDDDVHSRRALALLLADWGCKSVVTASLSEALVLLEGHGAPDAVLSDYTLAGGHTGVEVIEELRRRYGPLAGAILTGESSQVRERLASELEYPVLGKPVSAAELRGLLDVFKGIG